MERKSSFRALNEVIIQCRKCPRLVAFRENVPPKKGFSSEEYWRRPVPGFGDPQAWLLITGMAPAEDGGNRTGRVFTGDKTSAFLYKALHAVGFANQPTSTSKNDGLQLQGCYLTAAVKCCAPERKPSREEMGNCNCYYQNELLLLKNMTHILVLGKMALDATILTLRATGQTIPTLRFGHGLRYEIPQGPIIYCSYHPSPRNTNTGTLTEKMFIDLLQQIQTNHPN